MKEKTPINLQHSSMDLNLLAIVAIIVFAAVMIVQLPSLEANALTIDDDMYMTENPLVQNPGWNSAWRFLSEVLRPSTVKGYYQPLAMISLMLDYAMGGRENDLMVFHRTSLILHACNTVLVIILLYMLFGDIVIAAGLGLLFGLHPMRVETIAWVGERKTVLSAFFALISLISYVKYSKKNCRIAYIGCLITYILAVMSKPISVPLPCVMLLMDYWPLNRLSWKCIKEKLVFFGLAGTFAVITYYSQKLTAVVVMPSESGPMKIIYTVCHNIIFYIYKTVWPLEICNHYNFPRSMDLSNNMILTGVIGTCILIPVLVISLRWTRAAITGWLIFFITLLPTMQLIGFTDTIASNKFMYLPKIGLLMAIAAGCLWLFKKFQGRAVYVFIITTLVLGACEAVASRHYLDQWKDSITLHRYTLSVSENSVPIRNNLGLLLAEDNNLVEAEYHFARCLEINPNYVLAANNMGNIYLIRGDLNKAIHYYRRALEINNEYTKSNYNLGRSLFRGKEFAEAEKYLIRTTELDPSLIVAYFDLARLYETQGKIEPAIGVFNKILQVDPLNIMAKKRISELSSKTPK